MVRLCERKVGLTQHRALSAPVVWWVVSPRVEGRGRGGEGFGGGCPRAKPLWQRMPMFSCMLGPHRRGRAEARAAESRCLALRCESVRRSLVSCADAGCDNTFDIVLFCNSSRLNSPNCRLQLVQSETADITVCRSFLQQLTQEFTRKSETANVRRV